MHKHILIATDGSEPASQAVAYGIALAKEHAAIVTVVTVTEPWSAFNLALDTGIGNHNPLAQYEAAAAAGASGESHTLESGGNAHLAWGAVLFRGYQASDSYH